MTDPDTDTRAAGGRDGDHGDLTPLPAPGMTVAGYRIVAAAGSGGMGVVYRARDEELDRDVALKLIAPEYARDPAFRALFIRESLAAAALEHPHVVPVYRSGEDDGRLYTAMRFVDGESLAGLLARGPVPPALAVRLLTQVAGALDAAHARGLVHRDVKPGNILIGGDEGDETAYLTDFGLALRGDGGDPAEGWAGTVAYLAPEQAAGGEVDGRADVYALGCVLFHALAGHVPFPAPDREAAVVAHLTAPPPLVSEAAPGVPRGFDAVVRRAMAKDPDDRYATAREFAEALSALGFDVFLAHDAETAEVAEGLAAVLRDRGLDVATGSLDALRTSSSCAVLVGPGGLGPWAAPALAVTTDMSARDRTFRTVAVLCPGAPEARDVRLAALAGRPWVDLRDGDVGDGVRVLVRALGVEYVAIAASLGEGVCPYPGLAAFDEASADLFVGREDDVEALLARLDGRRFLAVSGPSGSGKSSLVAAGLVPAVRAGRLPGVWSVVTLTPGSDPAAALDAVLEGLAPGVAAGDGADRLHAAAEAALPPDGRLLVVVDQFEELFTLVRDDAGRRAFIDRLLFAATVPGGRVHVVPVMRADFIGHCAAHENLRVLVGDNGFLVGALTPVGLRRAIEVPARRAGLQLEPGLTRRIVADVGDRPGTLPLVQQLLVELWHRRRANELTLEAYASSGGVEGALARRADTVLEGLSPERQGTARRVLLRLTQPGEGTENTRRRALRSELVTEADDPADVDAVVAAFADARLVTTSATPEGAPTVEVAHEALIRSWPRLREWIDEDREALRQQHRLSEAAAEWERAGRDEALLFRGSRLARWEERGTDALNAIERAFVAASVERRDRSERARRRRTRATIAGLAAGIALVGSAGGYALVQREAAQDDRDEARSRQLAVSAREQAGLDPELSLLLAAEALAADPTAEAEAEFRRATAESFVTGAYRGHEAPQVYDVAASADGRLIASASGDDTVRFWDRDGTPRRTVRFAGDVYGVALSADGRTAATAGFDDGLVVVDTASGRKRTIDAGGIVTAAISRDGRRVAAPDQAGSLREWDTRSGRLLRTLGTHPGGVFQVNPTPDGGWVTSGAAEGSVYVWPARGTGAQAVYRGPRSLNDVAVSPDGRWIAAAGQSSPSGLYVWRAGEPGGAPRVRRPSVGQDLGVSFSPDSRYLAVGSGDGRIRIMPVAGGDPVRELIGHDAIVYRTRFLPGGELVSASDDGLVLRWRWDDALPRRASLPVGAEPAQPAGRALALRADGVSALSGDGAVWSWTPGRGPRRTRGPAEGGVNDVTLTPDGRRLVWIGTDFVIRFADAVRPRRPLVIPELGAGDQWQGAAVTDDGTRAVGATFLGLVVEWDLRTGGEPRRITPAGGFTHSATFLSPSGDTLVVAAFDGSLRVWGPDRGDPRVLTGHSAGVLAGEITADERYLVTGSTDRTVRVWELATGGDVAVLRGHRDVTDAAFGAGGERVVSAGPDGVRVWDWRRGTQLAVFTDPSSPSRAALSADGRTVVGLGSEGTANRLVAWTCATCGPLDEVRDLAASRTTRDLTPDERAQFSVDP